MSSVMHKGVASRAKPKKPVDPLSKRIPENPRYKNVKSTIDTGASMSKYMSKIEDLKTNYKFRKDEIFKRMKITTCVQLFIQVHRLSQPDDYDDIPPTPSSVMGGDDRPETADLEIQRMQGGRSPSPSLVLTEGDYGGDGREPESSRSTLLSVTRGIGELDVDRRGGGVSRNNAPVPIDMSLSPYLLLDIRDKDEYDQCHIIPALSYSKAYLSRATNYESKEMLQFKNREGKIIVIYDDDEKIAPIAATTLVQRGYDNIFMLSGGFRGLPLDLVLCNEEILVQIMCLKVASKIFPEGLITGTLPFSVSGVKPKEVKMANRTNFTNDDINSIEIFLNNTLQESGTSSRAGSKASSLLSSRQSVTSNISYQSSAITDRPAFR